MLPPLMNSGGQEADPDQADVEAGVIGDARADPMNLPLRLSR